MANFGLDSIRTAEPQIRIPDKTEPISLPSSLKETVRSKVAMDLDSLRSTLVPTIEMAKKIEADSDPVGWIHGLKLILSKSNHYKWKIDGSIEEGKWTKTTGPKINPVVKWLIDFQVGSNSPYRLWNDGRPLVENGSNADLRVGIPKEEIGKLWPVTLTFLLDYAKRNGIELPPSRGDKKFESSTEFIQKYGPMVDYLTSALGLPNNLILGIAKQESNLGTNPADYWWGNGVLQLTSAPLADMSWVTSRPWVTDVRKIGIYQKLYRKVDTDVLKWLPFGTLMKNLESSLDADAWNVVETLCDDSTSPEDFRTAMQKVRSWERGKFRGLTYHTLNILVGSIYLAYIKDYRLKGSQNVASIAQMYNGSENKEKYASSVYSHVQRFANLGRPMLRTGVVATNESTKITPNPQNNRVS